MTKKATHNQFIFDATVGALAIKMADVCSNADTPCPFNAGYRHNCPFEGRCEDVSPAQWMDFFAAMLSPAPPVMADEEIARRVAGDHESSKPPTYAMDTFLNLFSE